MIIPFVSFLRDHAKEVELGRVNFKPNFLERLSSGALMGGFTRLHFKLSANRAPETLIRRFLSF